MEFLFVAVIFVLWILSYVACEGEVVAPSFLACTGFLITSVVYACFAAGWGSELSPLTLVVVAGALLSLIIGEGTSRVIFLKNRPVPIGAAAVRCCREPSDLMYLAVTGLSAAGLLIQLLLVGSAASDFGDEGGALAAYRFSDGESGNVVTTLFSNAVVPLCLYASIAILVLARTVKGTRPYRWIAPLLICSVAIVFTSNRFTTLCTVSTGAILLLFAVGSQCAWKMLSLRMIVVGFFLFVAIMVVFSFLGTLTGKVQSIDGAIEGFGIYAGGSIALLNQFLQDFSYNASYVGTETLYGVQRLLGPVGSLLNMEAVKFLPASYIGKSLLGANTYTALRRYIHDYSYAGMVIIMVVWGFSFGKLYAHAKRCFVRADYFPVLVYAQIVPYLLMLSIDECLLLSLPTITEIATVIGLYFIARRVLGHAHDTEVYR